MRLVFLSVDKDASGTVEKKELIDHMERLDKQLSRAEIENLVKFIDKDGDGELTLEEL
uniref:EF-hand domain-containing protein n=1 Tax=Guillardia theta (strain CCMP2712) TaxID=905079 RepID=A0A0C3TVW4_GUITC